MRFFACAGIFCFLCKILFAETIFSESTESNFSGLTQTLTTSKSKQALHAHQEDQITPLIKAHNAKVDKIILLFNQKNISSTVEAISIALTRTQELTEQDCEIIQDLSKNNSELLYTYISQSSQTLQMLYQERSLQEASLVEISTHDSQLGSILKQMPADLFYIFYKQSQKEAQLTECIAQSYAPTSACTIHDQIYIMKKLLTRPRYSLHLFAWQRFDIAKILVRRQSLWRYLVMTLNEDMQIEFSSKIN